MHICMCECVHPSNMYKTSTGMWRSVYVQEITPVEGNLVGKKIPQSSMKYPDWSINCVIDLCG